MKLLFIKNKEHGILSYRVNDDKQFIAAEDVPREKDLKYRMAVTMGYGGSAIKLVEPKPF